MFWSLFFGISLAVFAVFGFACATQMILDACFPLRQIVTAVEVKTAEDVALLEMLLQEAKNGFLRGRSPRRAVLLSEDLCENGEIPLDILKILKKHGADCYLIESGE